LLSFKLGLIPNLESNDPKETRIYRFVTPETKGAPIPIGQVSDPEILLAMSLDLPAAWMTISTYSNADLDNIRPAKVPHLQASFSLNHIVIEGQVTFQESGDVATGKIVQLYNKKSGLLEDETSVMANFGYYQLKGTPGKWNLRVKSSIHEDENFEYPITKNGGDKIELISFGGKFNRIKLSSETIKIPKIESNIKQAEINVFSLASGLFYERLLRIMITSVMKKTKKSVKFWLLETTMSAKGILALEALSKEFGFEYEFMAYKWPSWLNPQSKKHRTIWAYKILFLDVLFPQNLNRIIFIDADQVVRSDLIELVELDLNGHVYAMTPFCNDKGDMAPYRFWEHNYWKNHLAGKPYHISALFVVDLLELRKKLVADIIRSQYHILSQDPNSLANLDQDLPNNLQNHIPIYSLPQEWLWCDTWCSQKTKSKAKTIDLCNNPKTFESKFDQAIRIIPEWKSYDDEIKLILEKGKEYYLKNLKKATEFEEHYEL
jgi:UDP-glucose:glycoprotein glucosyltransferase